VDGDHPIDPDPPETATDEARPVIGYGEAVAELEEILAELEDDTVDVDVLAQRVRRAAELIRICRARIAGARLEVEQVVAELDAAGTDAEVVEPG
jgi:exodeoxyribonuclease VII small subunit